MSEMSEILIAVSSWTHREHTHTKKHFLCKKSQCSVDTCRKHSALKQRIDFLCDAGLSKHGGKILI